MQRWFFLDDRTKETSSSDLTSDSLSSGTSRSFDTQMREVTFSLTIEQELRPNEVVAITGSWETLGKWEPQNSIIMKSPEDSGAWKTTIDLPRDHEISYRYFVGAIDPSGNILIRNWETNLETRKLPELYESNDVEDRYGGYNKIEKIDRGWLTNEKILQLKFFNAPFKWKQKIRNHTFYVKITPMAMRINCESIIANTLDDSLSNDTRETSSDLTTFAFTDVVSLKYDESVLKAQEQFGTPCGPDDLVIFNITVSDFDNIAYLVDLYAYSTKSVPKEPPLHVGYHYILPNVLKRSEGKLELPITCATKHRPIGMMQFGYLLIKPFPSLQFNMERTYQRYWNKKWTGLDVGHRGSGTSFKTKDSVIRENTIYSLKNAALHGADMVEFDVQLSKDLVPVIYHDFNVYVSLKSKSPKELHEFLELPMKELTLDQLKNFKLYHVEEGRSRQPRNFKNDHWQENQPFPQLVDVLEAIDEHVGFNIEIKWSQELVDGTTESENTIDRNLYVDCILEVVLCKASRRRIVFSCFDPDICTMLRYKQNVYPVMFLTLGQTERYKKYADPRCNTIENAVCNARAMELLGIVAHTEDLLRDPTQVDLATNVGLTVFCWGEDNNSKDTILKLKGMGLHAIIYDKMEVLTTKTVKESVFLVEPSNTTQNDILKLQCLESTGQKDNWKMNDNQQQQQPDKAIYTDYENFFNLEHERVKLSLSTATSIDTLLSKDII